MYRIRIRRQQSRHLRRASRSQGFSLIELVITMAILGIALIGIAQLIPAGLRRLAQTEERASALTTLREKVEELENLPFTSSELAPGTTGTETVGEHTLRWSVIGDYPTTGGKRLDVTVLWTGAREESLRVTAYLVEDS